MFYDDAQAAGGDHHVVQIIAKRIRKIAAGDIDKKAALVSATFLYVCGLRELKWMRPSTRQLFNTHIMKGIKEDWTTKLLQKLIRKRIRKLNTELFGPNMTTYDVAKLLLEAYFTALAKEEIFSEMYSLVWVIAAIPDVYLLFRLFTK